jgi:hypothetical protein
MDGEHLQKAGFKVDLIDAKKNNVQQQWTV